MIEPMDRDVPFTAQDIEGSIPTRFARIAAARPDAIAVAIDDRALTYRELDRQSDRIAAEIIRLDSGSETAVAVLLGDQISVITGMLATWKAGRLCVPLDPTLPPARVE